MVILDTCALVELCLAKPKIRPTTLKKIQDFAIILSVSFAELALKVKKGALEMNVSVKELYEKYIEIPSIKIENINPEMWFDSIDMDWHHKDPADRLIVGYAKRHDVAIVSSDKQIKKFYRNVIW